MHHDLPYPELVSAGYREVSPFTHCQFIPHLLSLPHTSGAGGRPRLGLSLSGSLCPCSPKAPASV